MEKVRLTEQVLKMRFEDIYGRFTKKRLSCHVIFIGHLYVLLTDFRTFQVTFGRFFAEITRNLFAKF